MIRSLRFTVPVAALLMVLALSGCGKSSAEPESPTPSAPTNGEVTGTTSSTRSTGATGGTTDPTEAKLDPASKRFAVKLDAICRKYDTSEAEVYYADAVASGEDGAADLDEMISNYRKLLRAGNTLEPPAAAKADFEGYLDSVRALVKQSEPVPQALEARNKAAIGLGAGNCLMDSAD